MLQAEPGGDSPPVLFPVCRQLSADLSRLGQEFSIVGRGLPGPTSGAWQSRSRKAFRPNGPACESATTRNASLFIKQAVRFLRTQHGGGYWLRNRAYVTT